MKVFCYGAGAVGCLLGGRLAAWGHNVTLLARPAPAEALRQRGLALRSPDGSVSYARPHVVTGLAELRADETPFDLVILAVKSYDTASATGDLGRLCAPETAALTVQNGVGNEEILCRALGAERVLAGSFTLSVGVPEAGTVVQHTSSGGLALAEVQRGGKRLGPLVSAFARAGLKARPCGDWRAMKWSKLLLNILGNASCAILDMPPADVFSHPRLFRVEQAAFREARRVMRRLRLRPVDLPGYPVGLLCAAMALPAPLARRLVAPRAAGGRGEKAPSLALDIASGKGRTEVMFLNGAVAGTANELGLRAPVNARLARTLEAISSGEENREWYRGRPRALFGALSEQ